MAKRFQVVSSAAGRWAWRSPWTRAARHLCALVESRAGLASIPKGQNLTQRTLEHFQFWGVVDEIRAARLLPTGFRSARSRPIASLNERILARAAGPRAGAAFYSRRNDRLPQYQMEEVLRAKMATLPDVRPASAGPRPRSSRTPMACASRSRNEDGRTEVLEADYVVGCDGARSSCASRSASRAAAPTSTSSWCCWCSARASCTRALKRFPPRSTYRAMHPDLQGYWKFFGRIDVGEGFFFHAPVPPTPRATISISMACWRRVRL